MQVFRHGDRSAIRMIPNDDNTEADWPMGLGQLTPVSADGIMSQLAPVLNNHKVNVEE